MRVKAKRVGGGKVEKVRESVQMLQKLDSALKDLLGKLELSAEVGDARLETPTSIALDRMNVTTMLKIHHQKLVRLEARVVKLEEQQIRRGSKGTAEGKGE